MSDAAFLARPAIVAASALGLRADPRLKKLVGLESEKVRHPVQIGQLHLPGPLEEFIDRGGVLPKREGQCFLVFFACHEQRFHILANLNQRF